jgi:hypothetical protein
MAAPETKGAQLFLDIHELGPGAVSAKAVADAHKKDLEVESEFGVRFLNYWVDEANGKVLCLSKRPTPTLFEPRTSAPTASCPPPS